jgi:predicted RND superfamily exporter protein
MSFDPTLVRQPVIRHLEDFDKDTGSWLERLFFNHRLTVIVVCALITLAMGYEATKLRLNASFEKMIPTGHPYIANYIDNKEELPGLGNSIRIAVETTRGTILDPNYLETLRKINDEVLYVPGVDRVFMRSLWTPLTRWAEVTEEGYQGGPVIADTYDGSPKSVEQVRINIEKSGEIGQLVAGNFKSSILYIPLMDFDAQSGKPLDYHQLSNNLEKIRSEYQRDPTIKLHITGFAKVVGDLIDGLEYFLLFFIAAIFIDAGLRFGYIQCFRSTALVVACSLVAVIWLLGLLPAFGYDLDPYSILVPFLIFSIGMSHGSQKLNGILQDIGRGTHRVVAARYTFRRLFLAGVTALLCDAVGFAVLIIIKIRVIQELALMASIGVAILIFTNLLLLPILLSYTGVSPRAAERSLRAEKEDESGGGKHHILWRFLDLFTRRNWATIAIVASVVLGIIGYIGSQKLKIGDLDPGAPELRPDSRYNRDNAFTTTNYNANSDILVVMVKTPNNQANLYNNLMKTDALEWDLQQLPGVESTNSLVEMTKHTIVAYNEGSMKWFGLLPNQAVLNSVLTMSPRDLFNQSLNLLSLFVYLKDHKADTLTSVVNMVEEFSRDNSTKDLNFLLAAGSAGIEAATNIVVKKAMHDMLYWVYGAVILLCFITFRSWRALVVSVIPLILTSVLCEALMAWMGIGVKVATLPVVALGVGIGVDYALYVVTVLLARLNEGMTLSEAYYKTLCFTGRVVVLTGLTLAFGVATWVFSPIKFQADMGFLLVFMFVWNMLGALILIPALAYYLLPSKKSETVPEAQPVQVG